MLTRCPRCDTTFRVTPEQLKARHGRVRCGHCQDVFNALDTLVEAAPQPAPAESALPVPATEEPTTTSAIPDQSPVADVEIVQEILTPVSQQAAEEPVVAANEPFIADTAGTAEPETALDSDDSTEAGVAPDAKATEPAASPPAEPGDDAAAIPALEPLLHEAPPRRVWPWALGSVVALVALLLQAAIHYRTEISILYPAAKPLLTAACEPLGCDVPLPHKPELIGIETSSLSPDALGKLALSATLKNRAPFAQQYPNLELTLTDTADQALVRRVLAPADYLPPKTDIAAGIGAGNEVAVNLAVDAPGMPAAGYQLYLFYP